MMDYMRPWFPAEIRTRLSKPAIGVGERATRGSLGCGEDWVVETQQAQRSAEKNEMGPRKNTKKDEIKKEGQRIPRITTNLSLASFAGKILRLFVFISFSVKKKGRN